MLYNETGHTDSAAKCAGTLASRFTRLCHNVMKIVNEDIRLRRLGQCEMYINAVHSAVLDCPGSVCKNLLYHMLLAYKDISAEAEFAVRTYLSDRNPKHKDELLRLRELHVRAQDLKMNENNKEAEIQEATAEIEELEERLAESVREIDFRRHMEKMTPEDVKNALPSNSALLEFGWFENPQFNVRNENENNPNGRYYAFLLHGGCEIEHEYLDEDAVINAAVNAMHEKIQARKNANAELANLHRLLIAPFEKYLTEVKHLYIAPEGELCKVPFELFPLPVKFRITYISTGRDFIRKKYGKSAKYKDAAVIYDPKFTLSESEETEQDDDRGNKTRSSNITGKYPPLIYAAAEANALVRTFKGNKTEYTGVEATKFTLSEIGSPGVIHIVTHGFAHEKKTVRNESEKSGGGFMPHSAADDPLTRCALVFAGVNDWERHGESVSYNHYGNGILTAKEVLKLDLPDTDLLVLSACETARGQVWNGLGIQGLRRAFELTGVRSIICTLWSVADDASAILMEQFYKNLFEHNKSKVDALEDAKEYVKSMTFGDLINYYKENGFEEAAMKLQGIPLSRQYFREPYFWAGYILLGDSD